VSDQGFIGETGETEAHLQAVLGGRKPREVLS
jgi:hypothetical protein